MVTIRHLLLGIGALQPTNFLPPDSKRACSRVEMNLKDKTEGPIGYCHTSLSQIKDNVPLKAVSKMNDADRSIIQSGVVNAFSLANVHWDRPPVAHTKERSEFPRNSNAIRGRGGDDTKLRHADIKSEGAGFKLSLSRTPSKRKDILNSMSFHNKNKNNKQASDLLIGNIVRRNLNHARRQEASLSDSTLASAKKKSSVVVKGQEDQIRKNVDAAKTENNNIKSQVTSTLHAKEKPSLQQLSSAFVKETAFKKEDRNVIGFSSETHARGNRDLVKALRSATHRQFAT